MIIKSLRTKAFSPSFQNIDFNAQIKTLYLATSNDDGLSREF